MARKILKRRDLCIHGCGRSVREPGTECRKCRRKRVVKVLRILERERNLANREAKAPF